MAPRPFWEGYLKLLLVTCPVAMTPATTGSEKVRFHILNEKTGNRVVSRYVDATTGKPVDGDEQVKGYQVADDKHIMVEDEELESVALESTRTIDIDRFVPADTVEPIWLDKAHYLTSADEVGGEAFAVIRQAMTVTKTAGLARLCSTGASAVSCWSPGTAESCCGRSASPTRYVIPAPISPG